MSTDNKKKDDYLAEHAINHGIKLKETEQEESVIKYTNSELDKIQKLTDILALSKEAFMESAISYLHFRFTSDKENTQKTIHHQTAQYQHELKKIDIEHNIPPKERDRLKGKIKLSPETSQKLDELNMKGKINECLFTGINLLYEQLIDIKPAKSEN
ncbi:hypothetical protein NWP21_15150 [Anabaenopsis sp. FSS-46]|uniref:hypothetical protein n=1 Tax=Anabaenopsis sp. FSS-46 TaxID=2971766 RepID=UPI0024746AAC|nr:hypothetical protein [Anabaenopsis sp. FSS-46]MDH6100151.1 hypothetical protein [Anabaenopsis sp. FSS-46]